MNHYHHALLINIIGLGVAIALYCFLIPKSEILLGVIGSSIGASISYINYKISEDKLFKDLFSEFNQKYDCKFNEGLNKITDDTTIETLDSDLINDYLNFSAEEYLWYKKGRIPNDVWNAWEAGIKFHLMKPAIKKFVRFETTQRESYYGLFEKLKL